VESSPTSFATEYIDHSGGSYNVTDARASSEKSIGGLADKDGRRIINCILGVSDMEKRSVFVSDGVLDKRATGEVEKKSRLSLFTPNRLLFHHHFHLSI
jgi:hypothetical protein